MQFVEEEHKKCLPYNALFDHATCMCKYILCSSSTHCIYNTDLKIRDILIVLFSLFYSLTLGCGFSKESHRLDDSFIYPEHRLWLYVKRDIVGNIVVFLICTSVNACHENNGVSITKAYKDV